MPVLAANKPSIKSKNIDLSKTYSNAFLAAAAGGQVLSDRSAGALSSGGASSAGA